MPFRLRRGDAPFGDLLNDLATRVTGAAGLLTQLLGEPGDQMHELLADLRAAEQATDAAANAVLRALSAAIVTPFDREDLFRVAWAMRGCVVRITAAGEDLIALELDDLPPVVTDLVQLLARAAEIVEDTVRRIHQPELLADAAIELNRLAGQAREARRRFLAQVDGPDLEPGRLVRRAAVIASLTAAVESFEDLAAALQTVAVKEG